MATAQPKITANLCGVDDVRPTLHQQLELLKYQNEKLKAAVKALTTKEPAMIEIQLDVNALTKYRHQRRSSSSRS